MSFQLIYTSAAHLLDSEASGYGVVARSQSLPRALLNKLIELSEYKEPADAGIIGPQYSYRALDCSGTLFHVLSCVQDAGADYTRRRCHIAHHLALTYDEVQALRRNASRPTPAGVALALKRASFWLPRWEGEPRYIESEPRLTAASLPDAATQATWKAMTGHKSNARAFFTPPYDRACLIVAPRNTRSEDLLLLINESDWLSAARGWGRTFTTYGVQGDSFSETQRICVATGSDLEQRTAFKNKPILRIGPSLSLPDSQDDSDPDSSPLGSGISKAARASDPSALSPAPAPSGHFPYKYVESPDEETFDAPPPCGQLLKASCYLAGLLALAGGLYALISAKVDDVGEAAGKIIVSNLHTEKASAVKSSLSLLQDLAAAPYSTEKTLRVLDKLEAKQEADAAAEPDAQEQLLADCTSILRHASIDSQGHAANLHRLGECAVQLGIDADNLCRLHMHEATHDRPLEDWSHAITPEEAAGWDRLLQESPQMAAWLLQPPFLPFIQAALEHSIPAPEADNGEAGGGEESGPDDEEGGTPQEDERQAAPESVYTMPLMAGNPLPANVAELFSRAPVELDKGDYMACLLESQRTPGVFASGMLPGERARRFAIEPDPSLPGCYLLRPAKGAPLAKPTPQVRIEIKDGILQSVTSNGMSAAVRLSVPAESGALFSYLLVDSLELPVVPMGESLPPHVSLVGLAISPGDVEVEPAAPGSGAGKRLALRGNKFSSFPWAPLSDMVQLRRPIMVQLPVLAGANHIMHAPSAPALPYAWKCSPAVQMGSAYESWEFQIFHTFDFSYALQKRFLQVANESCCRAAGPGKDPALTLANLYALTLGLQAPKLEPKERKRLFAAYCKLFADRGFASILERMLSGEPHLCLTPEQATGSGGAQHRRRALVEKELENPANLATIRQRICQTLTANIEEAYMQERSRQAKGTISHMALRLQRINMGEQGEMLWHFTLEPVQE